MRLIIGLGNPGPKYQQTRHNLGFMILEKLCRHFKEKECNFSDFEFDKKSNAEISEGQINREKVLFVIPQTYMNHSGFAVLKLVQFYKLDPQKNILVIYDDIDLPLGKIRTSGESSGGHKGMQSIIDLLGTKKIPRLRCGILPKPKNEINPHTFSRDIGHREKNLKNLFIPRQVGNIRESVGIKDTAAYVLEKFSNEELEIITKKILPKIILKVEEFLSKR